MSDEENSNNNVGMEQIEKDARTFGWVPLEEFRGGEEKWVDAETFVKRGKEINPILKKNNELLLKKLDEANKRVEEIGKAADEFRTFQKDAAEKRVKEYETQLKELRQAKSEAVTSGDGERVVAIDDAIDEVKEEVAAAKAAIKEQPKEETKTGNTIDPILQNWIDKNEWYVKDKRMAAIANSIAAEIRSENPDLINQPFLDRLSKELKETFPDKFGNKKPGNPVESGSSGTRPGSRGGKTYENLPPEAKAACDRFVKTMPGYTREKYLADYYAE